MSEFNIKLMIKIASKFTFEHEHARVLDESDRDQLDGAVLHARLKKDENTVSKINPTMRRRARMMVAGRWSRSRFPLASR